MKKYCLFIAFSIYSYISFSQYQWNNKYDFGYPVANAQGVVYDSITNQYIVEGARGDANGLGAYGYLQSISESGVEIEMKVISEADSIEYLYDQGAISYFNDKYYVCGAYYGADGKRHGLLVRYNTDLDTVFTKVYREPQNNKKLFIRLAQATNDNIFLVGGLQTGTGNSMDALQGFFIVTDSVGTELSRTLYTVGGYYAALEDIKQAGNNWVCTGFKMRHSPDMPSTIWEYHALLLLYNSQGDLLQQYTTPENTNGYSCVATQDGGFALCGNKVEYLPWGIPGEYLTLNKGYIEKVNVNMQRQWNLTLSKIDTTIKTCLRKIIENPDGTLVAAGTGVDAFNHKHISGWMVKVSADGQVLWQRYHKVINTSYEEHFFNDMCKAHDGGYALAGVALDPSGEEPVGTYAWVCKTDSFGCLVPGCQTVGIAENTPLESSLKLYPNPASDRLFLYYHNPQLQNCVFTISDISGREIVPKTALENSTTYEIPVREWVSGMYFIEVQDGKGNIHTEKFIKE
ncbi:MAG: T9SS type A sorting domain-containing protein [Bacteroidia bacterium]|nr:T9SS type A sorting domain-containing protein [Bacteroidia bacterium]